MVGQTHPQVNKDAFTRDSLIALKDPTRAFPTDAPVGVLKWRLQTTDERLVPLSSASACARVPRAAGAVLIRRLRSQLLALEGRRWVGRGEYRIRADAAGIAAA